MRFVFAQVLALVLASAQYKQPPVVVMDPKDAIALVNQLFGAIQPALPENSYMPDALKEKINWMYGQQAANKLSFKLVTDDNGNLGVALMHSFYQNHAPVVEINANQLMVMVRIQERVRVGFNRTAKDTFAIVLAHEAIHLEKPEAFYTQKIPDPIIRKKTQIAEEFRAWRLTDQLIISELLKTNQPVPIGFRNLHEALKHCTKAPSCVAFEKFYSQFNLR
ncbi:MAG: hypothetical protein KW788_01570 [Candidatus Doudnabacteria bacterium]|nr:hypothetical protein [Candidatus Doudnabacteria bacterium]